MPNRDTISDAADQPGIASVAGGAAVSTDGGAAADLGPSRATSGVRGDSLLSPDVAPPRGGTDEADDETAGGTLLGHDRTGAGGEWEETPGGTLLAPDLPGENEGR